jgi:NAD(P)-dependent dehydrogenase (short-subunit alcohol dehydrogenase family)
VTSTVTQATLPVELPSQGYERLRGKVAVVTGAAGGIGAATARLLRAAGAEVVVADIDVAGLTAVAERIGAVATPTDVTDEAAVQALVESTVARFGRLDVLHNNAVTSFAEDTDAVGTTDEIWRKTCDIVFMSVVWGCRHAIPAMLAGGGGSIINTSSGAAVNATGSRVAYGSFKAALESFTSYTAQVYGSQGIRANVVRPAFVLTDGTKRLFDQAQLDAFGDGMVLGRPALPDDVGNVVVFLASDEASYVNGQVLPVNGGGKKVPAW